MISLVIFALGAIPIAAILPYEKISLQSGVFDTFAAVITDVWHVGWLVPGAVAAGRNWRDQRHLCLAREPVPRGCSRPPTMGSLPPVLQATNRHGMPTHILLVQGAVVTLMSLLYFVIEDVSVVFFLISAMTIALYLIAYMLMYAAAIKLALQRPKLAASVQRARRHCSACG